MAGEKRKGGRETEPMETEQELTAQEYEHLLAQYEDSFKNLQEGQIIRGRVLAITPSEVIVDIGYKSEGIIPLSEFTDSPDKSRSSKAIRWTSCSSGPKT